MDQKRVLAAVFALGLEGKRPDRRAVSARLGLTPEETGAELRRLSDSGLLRAAKGGVALTRKGRASIRVVFIGGGFEIIHFGHVHTISRAKKLGDALIVSVARDSTIRRRKGREPVVGERDRAKLLSALRDVDAAILGSKDDIYVTLEKVAPDVVALGYDQHHMEEDIMKEAGARGLKLRVVRLDSPIPDVKTTRLLREL
jgi:FAD synthetase